MGESGGPVIIELLLDGVYGLLYLISTIFPDVAFPWDDELSDFAVLIGGHLGVVNDVFPVAELLVVISWAAATLLPVVATFLVVRWAYAHLPMIGGS